MTARRVGPHPRPGFLGQSPPRYQDLPCAIEDVAGERQVERCVGGVDGGFVRRAYFTSVLAQEDDQLRGCHRSLALLCKGNTVGLSLMRDQHSLANGRRNIPGEGPRRGG